MRRAIWLLVILAGTTAAQRRPIRNRGQADEQSAIAREMLDAHNRVRAGVGVPQLVWSRPLAAYAQDWAARLLTRRQFAHRPDSEYGENLFMISGGTVPPAKVVNEWASESRDYDLRSNSCKGVCGHYTQIVWDGTRQVGCGVAKGGGREIWVCNYDPAGNWNGRRPY